MRVLLTGATGFVGGRLRTALEAAGHEVRCASRDLSAARAREPKGDWVHFDLDAPGTLDAALEGVDTAFFLVHGLAGARDGYNKRELAGARAFAAAAGRQRLSRIVYLGGVAPPARAGSKHLRSRLAVGEALREGPVPCLELRASMIVGHGSASFRILRDLAARLPAMLFPRWMENRTEPVAIDDVVAALMACLTLSLPESEWQDLPGPEALSGRQMLMRTAAKLGMHPRTLRVPLLTPRLSARWLWLVSGVDHKLAEELVDGFRSDLIAEKRGFRERAGLPPPIPFDEAVQRALDDERRANKEPIAALIWEWMVPHLTRRS